MSFGSPILLWGLLAVPLPLVVHLFFRRKRAEVPFSTLLFFRPHRREWAMRRRIREALLLALRCLAIAAVVLAFAQPLLRSGPAFLGGATQAVLLLDDTLSMDRRLASGETAFAAAVGKAGEILDTLAPGDSAALLFLSGRDGIPATRDLPVIRQRLETARVTGAAGSFAAGVDRIAATFRQSRESNREGYILSDFQRNQFPKGTVSLQTKEGCRLYLLPLPGGEENLSLDPLIIGTRPKRVGTPFTVPYTVTNHGSSDRETTVRLLLDGAVAFAEPQMIPAGKTVNGTFEVVPDRAGSLAGAVELEDAALQCDNRRDFAVTVEDRLKVLLIESELGNRARPFHFFRAAIDPEPGAAVNGIDTELLFFDELTARNLREASVAVLGNPGGMPASVAALLRDHLRNGGTLIWLMGPSDTAETADAWLPPELTGWVGERKNTAAHGITFQGGLSELNPLIQRELLEWKRLHTFSRITQGSVLAETEGMPVLAEERVGNGRLIVSAASMRRDCGNWPELKSFPIAMIHWMTYAARAGIATAEAVCGTPVTFAAVSPETDALAFKLPDGTLPHLAVEGGKAVWTENWQTGVITVDGAYPRLVAVVPAAEESVLATVPAGQLKGRFSGGDLSVLKTETPLDAQVAAARRGRDLSGVCLVAAVLCLLGESVIAARKR